jgi:hypothetical protein
MQLNIDETPIIAFRRKTISVNCNYSLCDQCIIRTDSIEDLGVILDCKLCFRHHVDYVCSQPLKMLALVRKLTFSFSAIDGLLSSYFASVTSKLQYVSPVWNDIMASDADNLERVQRKFAAFCFARFSPHSLQLCLCTRALQLHTLQVRRTHFHPHFYSCSFRI